jgi:hypothetical protein
MTPPEPPAAALADDRYPMIDQRPEIDPACAGLIDPDQAMRLRAIPFRRSNGRLHVAMGDPSDFAAADEIAVTAGLPVDRYGAPAPTLDVLLRRHYGATAADLASRLGGDETQEELVANLEAIDADELHRMAEQPTLINLVNLIMLEAVRVARVGRPRGAVRQVGMANEVPGGRCAGQERPPPPKHLQPAITSRVSRSWRG